MSSVIFPPANHTYQCLRQNLLLSGNSTNDLLCSAIEETSSASTLYFWLLVIGQIGHAFGGSAVYTLGLPYMDTQIKTRDTPLYIGELRTSRRL